MNCEILLSDGNLIKSADTQDVIYLENSPYFFLPIAVILATFVRQHAQYILH